MNQSKNAWFVVAIAASLTLALLGAWSAQALPANMVTAQYYSDSGFQNMVGFQVVLRCFGGSGPVYGEVGDYEVLYADSCSVGGSYSPECKELSWECPDGTGHPETCYQVAPPHDIECPPGVWNL